MSPSIPKKKIRVSDLVIEVTRRCNMNCGHCLRGEPQDRDMCYSYMKALLEQISEIGVVTFSGGEPSLNTKTLNEFIDLCKKHNIPFDSFYIATNGKEISEEFVMTCLRLASKCEYPENCSVEISNDYWHAVECRYDESMLKSLSFYRTRDPHDSYYYEGVKQGRNELGKPLTCDPISVEEGRTAFLVTGGMLYLNVKGDVVCGCDWSYENQDHNVICKSNEDVVEGIRKFNMRHAEEAS